MTRVKITLNGLQRWGNLTFDGSSARLEVPEFPLTVALERPAIREALVEQATVQGDTDLWWDGYRECLADVERAAAASKLDSNANALEWAESVRRKFDLNPTT